MTQLNLGGINLVINFINRDLQQAQRVYFIASSSLLTNPDSFRDADFLSVIYLLTLVLKHATKSYTTSLAFIITNYLKTYIHEKNNYISHLYIFFFCTSCQRNYWCMGNLFHLKKWRPNKKCSHICRRLSSINHI